MNMEEIVALSVKHNVCYRILTTQHSECHSLNKIIPYGYLASQVWSRYVQAVVLIRKMKSQTLHHPK